MNPTTGQIVLVTTHDMKDRPAVVLERRGGDWIVIPTTTASHWMGKPAVAIPDWRENHLCRRSWLFHMLVRVSTQDMVELPAGRVQASPSLCESIIRHVGRQVRPTTCEVLARVAA